MLLWGLFEPWPDLKQRARIAPVETVARLLARALSIAKPAELSLVTQKGSQSMVARLGAISGLRKGLIFAQPVPYRLRLPYRFAIV